MSISRKFAGAAYASSSVCFLTFNRLVASAVSTMVPFETTGARYTITGTQTTISQRPRADLGGRSRGGSRRRCERRKKTSQAVEEDPGAALVRGGNDDVTKTVGFNGKNASQPPTRIRTHGSRLPAKVRGRTDTAPCGGNNLTTILGLRYRGDKRRHTRVLQRDATMIN